MTTLRTKFLLTICGTVLALGVFTGCDPAYVQTKCPSYVVCYVDLASIKLTPEPTTPGCILIEAENDFSKTYSLHSTGANQERYVQLCEKHKDLSYNQYRVIGGVLDMESVTYSDCDFSRIAVTADKDFDERHPAGTNLSDIVRFMSWSPYRYILSGYSAYYHYDRSDVSEAFDTVMRIYINKEFFDKSTDATCYPIDKLVKDLTGDDLTLVGGDDALALLGMLYFEKSPENEGEYSITVRVETDNDRTLLNSVKLSF